MYALLDRKGLQVQWSIEKLLEKREDVFSLFEEYIGFDIRKDIQSRNMANLIEKCEPCEYKDPWRLMSVAESRIYQSIYLGDKDMFHSSIENLDQTRNLIQPYLEIVESIYGKFDQRKEFWESQFGERDAVIKKVMENVANSKIKASVRLY